MEPDQDEGLKGLLKHRTTPGTLRWIGLRPARHAAMQSVDAVEALTDRGLQGDYTSARGSKKRQVSLIQGEHLPVIAALSGHAEVEASLLRRNLLITGISVLSLRASMFRIGDVVFEGTGLCEPCSKMEAALGYGGYNSMRGHGGILARIVEGGTLRLGSVVDFVR